MRLDISSAPIELDMLKRELRTKEVERESLRQDNASDEQLAALDRRIADLRERENNMNARWRNARARMQRIHETRRELEHTELNRQTAEEQGRYSDVITLQREAEILKADIEAMSLELAGEDSILKTALEQSDIMKVVTAWTGIPMTNLSREENEKLRTIESALHGSVVGQDEAVKAVANVIRRNRMGLSEASKPIGSFLFLGTTGVGKTELCKALAQYLFDSKDMMVRIDMSEYQQEHSVARLFGAPPGYVGYDQGGQLTEAVRRKPYSVVLFDEIEKAHPKVFQTLLQVLDEGRMTDGQGRVVNFKNTII
ncbi:MAG: AAA family ATPase, partial [Muribaculaceae bacterium]|nr:AAA family ATPase [Muribaculaceae bacterium]